MVAESAVLVASVIARVDRIEHTWLFLDAGVYNGLFESLAYQGSIRYRISALRPSYDAGEATFAIAGPTGDSWDVINREAQLPADITVGDKLVFHDVGAYNLVMVGRFNGFPKPHVHFV
jgi:ornithine decarboxylase